MRDVVIVGAGVAGLTAASLLARSGHDVLVLEKQSELGHRVCGEFISEQAFPSLLSLGLSLRRLGAVSLKTFEWTSPSGERFTTQLSKPGVGITRKRLDQALRERAEFWGAELRLADEVRAVERRGAGFVVHSRAGEVEAKVVLGCHGKRSMVDRARGFFRKKSGYLAVKRHYRGEFPFGLVSLNSFGSGYCGLSRVEEGQVNVCYLTQRARLSEVSGLGDFERQVLGENPWLKRRLARLEPVSDKRITVAQLHFGNKQPVEGGVLMAGDAALLVHPLVGSGIALGVRSGGVLAEAVSRFLAGEVSRQEMEGWYTARWRAKVNRPRVMGRLLHHVLERSALANVFCKTAERLPALGANVVRLTREGWQ